MRSNGRSPPPSSHRAASWSTPRQLRRRRCGPTTPVATALVLFAATLSAAPATSARRSPVAPPPAERAITCFVPSSDAHGRLGGGGGPSLAPDAVRPPLPPSRGPPLCGWGGSVMPSSTRGRTDASSTSRRTSTSTILHGARRGHKHHGGSGGVGRRGDRGDDGDGDGDRGRRRRRGGGDGRDPRGEERDGDERELGHNEHGRHFYSRKSLSDRSLLSVGGAGAEADVERRRVFRKLCGAADVARPSRVQALAWPVLLGDDGDEGARHAIVADQTGSGKTLAYLIPPLLRMLVDEKENEKNEVDGRPTNAPRILILAPTTELAHQLYGVCRRLSGRGIPFRTEVATSVPPPPNRGATEEDDDDGNAGGGGGRSRSYPGRRGNDVDSSAHARDQIRRLRDPRKSPVDVLVATPGRVASLVRGGVLDLTHLQSLVLDEVDVLMIDETFGPQLRAVGAKAPLSTRFVFVTATLPDSVVADVRKEFPDVVTVKGPGLHRVAPTLKEYLVDVSVDNRLGGTSNRDAKACFDVKAEELLGALRRTKCERTLVFCNTVESCRMVENFLKRRDRGEKSYRVGSYHGAMSPQARTRELALFSRGGTADRGGGGGGGRRRWGGGKGGLAASKDRVDRVLVCTDRAARGVDFGGAAVDHVVVFDFPSDPAEYVRRVGRTARAGRGGTSTVLAYGWQLPVARGIMGSRLEAGTAGGDDALVGGPFRDGRRGKEEDEDDDDAFHSRKRRRRRGSPGDAISDNIASGKLWKERKPR